ncbi:hypothetical protein NE398_11870 [Clostridium tertium]|uniref:Uncharacterized protein n=1 Tax=Clostridium tertium TaxID=1559 RepID=A0A9X3XK48_9CLOT|nr:hypothetical protein [Clostridium tertium]MDC4240855.1 hypothetical protein [Clostridium tertium]
MKKNLIELRDKFREIADILDEAIELGKREESGEDVEKEIESLMGRYLFKCIEVQELSKQ